MSVFSYSKTLQPQEHGQILQELKHFRHIHFQQEYPSQVLIQQPHAAFMVRTCTRSNQQMVTVHTFGPYNKASKAKKILERATLLQRIAHSGIVTCVQATFEVVEKSDILVHVEWEYCSELPVQPMEQITTQHWLSYFYAIAKAIAYLHDIKIVHENLQWSNILVRKNSVVVGCAGLEYLDCKTVSPVRKNSV